MTATPVSMHVMDGHSLDHTKFVLQIPRNCNVFAFPFYSLHSEIFRPYKNDVARHYLSIYINLIAFLSHSLINYWGSLVLLGLGWNFLFIGGTNLLPLSYNENEKFKVQSINDFLVFGFQAFAALSAGWLYLGFGWEITVLSVIPLLSFQLFLLYGG